MEKDVADVIDLSILHPVSRERFRDAPVRCAVWHVGPPAIWSGPPLLRLSAQPVTVLCAAPIDGGERGVANGHE